MGQWPGRLFARVGLCCRAFKALLRPHLARKPEEQNEEKGPALVVAPSGLLAPSRRVQQN